MYKVIILILLLSQITYQQCPFENCGICVYDTDTGEAVSCDTCRGWYESGDTGFCVLSARLIILCILMGLILTCVIICAVLKYQDYNAKFVDRPTNIQSFESTVNINDKELSQISWNKNNEKISETTKCGVCASNGSTIKLKCGHVFHGDCICWELRKADSCPTCRSTGNSQCRIYCLKCSINYLQCPPQYYVEVKKRKSRVCNQCEKGQ